MANRGPSSLRESSSVVIIVAVPSTPAFLTACDYRQFRQVRSSPLDRGAAQRGQVAQVVERSPEKAGVGGSTPSLATMFSIA
jgi:hypothetical protein